VRAANAYIDHQAPWALRKNDPERMLAVLRILCEALRTIGVLLQPFMPGSMAKLLDLLAVSAEDRSIAALERPPGDGAALPAPSAIFPRFVDTEA
jgi:methionyl-tRNA synthetase